MKIKQKTNKITDRPKKQIRIKRIFRLMSKNKGAMVGLIVISILIIVVTLAPVISPYDYKKTDLVNAFAAPSLSHLCGTDDMGRDILSRLIYGGRYSLSLGLIATLFAALIGTLIGSISGFFGDKIDNILMRLLDIIQAIPGLLLCIMVAAVLGNGFINTVFALAIASASGFARLSRASILNIRNMEYLEAATSINCSNRRIILKHVLPNALSPLIVASTMSVASTILFAASLSFIGLGVQPPTPEWGNMLSEAQNYVRNYPHMVIFPGLCIVIAVLTLNMLGDGLRDALDPKLKS